MTDSALRCVAGCGRPCPDAFVCGECSRNLVTELLDVPWLCDQLAITLARQDRVPASAGAGPESGPLLPPRMKAMQAADTLRHTLGPWVRIVAEQRAVPLTCEDNTPAMARWLVAHIDSIRQGDDAAELLDEVTYAIGQARRAIDRPPELCFRGPCDDCGTDLYCGADHRGRPVSAVITCRDCGRQYDTAKRETWLLARAQDRLATTTEIAQALPALYGREIKSGTIRQWINRGRLLPRAWMHQGQFYWQRQDEHDRPLCRIGDVIDLAERSQRP